jgi:membrane protein DedA with SNARE-associated domain
LGGWLEAIVDWVVQQVHAWGYAGIFVMMTVESTVFPFPSEVALIPAGYLVSQGKMDAVLATLAGAGGSLFGALLNYFGALWIGRPFFARVESWFHWLPGGGGRGLEYTERYFASHGEITTFVGRLIPGVRHLISIPAGLVRMNLARFAFYTTLGAGIWSAILVAVGYIAGQSEELWRPLLRDATLWMLGAIVLLVAVYVWRHRRRSAAA